MMDDENQASAPAGLAGYFYQVDVSVLVALDLMLSQKRLDQITLEPANHEDLAGDLNDETRVSGAARVTIDGYSLILQAKLRNIEPWDISNLQSLVERDDGDEAKVSDGYRRRDSPATLLKADPNLRYLMVTSAALKGVAREVGVRRLGEWPSTLPASLKSKVADGAGRIAVLDQLDEEKLEGQIRELLLVTCKVPRVNLQACLDDLRQIALTHMRNGPSVWTRANLEAAIAKHEGYLASAPEIETFVKPTNWKALVGALQARNGVLITGASGTGKTMAAEVLLDALKTKIDGAFKVVRVLHGPQEVWSWNGPGPVVFMIEDPWGKFRFHPEQRPWNAELERMLQGARKDRRFVVTTRSDVLAETDAKRLAPEWFVWLESQHYGPSERLRLFENRLKALPEATQRAAYQNRDLVLERLESPYEIQKFFDGLREGPKDDEVGPAFVRCCIDLAHYDAIETTVVEQVLDRDDALAGIAVWGLLKARPSLSWSIIPRLAEALGDKDRAVEDRIEPLIRFMAAGRNLRQPNATVSYYHPRVEAGLEQVIQKNPSRARRLLGDLVDVLLALDDLDDADWGQEAAAQLLQGAKRDGVVIRTSPSAQARIDAYVRRRLAAPSDRLSEDLRLAADIGSFDNQPAQLARWLGTRGKQFGNLDMWREEPLTDAKRAALQAEPAVADLAGRFVREVLPRTRDQFPDDFAERLAGLAGPQVAAFREAALRMVGDGHNWNAELVARGAFVDFPGFEGVLDAAVAEGRKLRVAHDDALWLEIRNGEHSEAYGEHLADYYHDEGDTADTFIRLYVETSRKIGGWRSLADHRHLDTLIWAWIAVLNGGAGTPQDGELEGLADACRGHRHESRFWELAGGTWSPALAGRLEARLRDPDVAEAVCRTALEAMARQAPAIGRTMLAQMVAADDLAGVLRWIIDLKASMTGYGVQEAVVAFATDLALQLGPFEPLANLMLKGDVVALQHADIDRLTLVDAAALPDLQLAKARLLSASGRPVRPLIEALMACPGAEADDIERAVAALAIAITQGAWDMVEAALTHRFADVRCDALVAVAPKQTAPLPDRLLDMARDKGSRVRLALLDILEAQVHPAHQGALLVLIEDTWSKAELNYGQEDPDYPIAQAAAALLASQAPLSANTVDIVLEVAVNTPDPDLRTGLMVAVGRQGGDHGLGRLVQLALEIGRAAVHAAAADALFRAGTTGADRAAQFTIAQLLKRGPLIATNMALAVGQAGERDLTLALAKAVAASVDRAALLVPLLVGASVREDVLANEIAALLPADLTLSLHAALERNERVPRGLIDGLGDFRVRDTVLWRLAGLFEKEMPT